MKQTRVLGFQVQVGNDLDGWVDFGARRDYARTAAYVANSAERLYVRADSIDVRVVRITETREVL